MACVKTKEGGWTLRLAVEATLPSAIDVVVEEEEVEAARARAGPPLRSVKYLPPIQLQLHLGPSYPLHAAPTFTLWAPWLDAAKGAWIEAEMGRMWKDVFQGGPVVFSWVEWLQHEMGEGLLALEEGGGVGGGDDDTLLPRLVLRGLPPPPRSIAAAAKVEEEVEGAAAAAAEGEEAGPHQDERALGDRDNVWGPRLMQTLAHTYARESEAFARASHRCFICFDEKGGREFFVLRCGHFWCRECLGEMARTHVRDGDVGLLVCPFPECGEELAWEVLKELLDAEAFARWEQLLLSKVCKTDTHVCMMLAFTWPWLCLLVVSVRPVVCLTRPEADSCHHTHTHTYENRRWTGWRTWLTAPGVRPPASSTAPWGSAPSATLSSARAARRRTTATAVHRAVTRGKRG